jgi:hypothetical protein
MARSLKEVIASLPRARRAAIDRRAAELISEELTLRDLRRALRLTQTDVATALGKGQDEVSRIERRGDLLLSTLHGYVRSLGGELDLICRFPNRKPVRIQTSSFRVRPRRRPRTR